MNIEKLAADYAEQTFAKGTPRYKQLKQDFIDALKQVVEQGTEIGSRLMAEAIAKSYKQGAGRFGFEKLGDDKWTINEMLDKLQQPREPWKHDGKLVMTERGNYVGTACSETSAKCFIRSHNRDAHNATLAAPTGDKLAIRTARAIRSIAERAGLKITDDVEFAWRDAILYAFPAPTECLVRPTGEVIEAIKRELDNCDHPECVEDKKRRGFSTCAGGHLARRVVAAVTLASKQIIAAPTEDTPCPYCGACSATGNKQAPMAKGEV